MAYSKNSKEIFRVIQRISIIDDSYMNTLTCNSFIIYEAKNKSMNLVYQNASLSLISII